MASIDQIQPPAHERQRLLAKSKVVIESQAWLYPFKGIYYFIAHPFLYPLLRARLLPCLILSTIVLLILFTFTYLPQVAFLAIWHGPLAWVNAAFLVLGEGSVLISLLFEAWLVDATQVTIFDSVWPLIPPLFNLDSDPSFQVLVAEGHADLVSTARAINAGEINPLKQLGKPSKSATYAPFSFIQIAEAILYLPLNLIPIVGTPLFLILTGHRAGPFHHWRYFALQELSRKEKRVFVHRRKWQYTWFGTVALVLQLIPVLSMFFLLTTAAGSALWAVKLEEKRQATEDEQRDMLTGQAAGIIVTPPEP
ncbi:MAG: hypothetical protein M1829_000379 [Trizodia sp. TS-e1964]|nr:MAG: hypothetical protein M1829_000379 [Trizodia sp. TS-e1964]